MFLEIFYKLPGNPNLRPTSDSRALVASALAGRAEPEFIATLLHQKDGQQISSLNPIRFGARAGNIVTVSVVGRDAVQYMLGNSHKLANALSEHFGTPLEKTRRCGDASVQLSPQLKSYAIPYFIWQPGRKKDPAFYERDAIINPRLVAEVEIQLRRGIERQADLVGCDVPEFLMNLKILRFIPVHVKASTWQRMAAVEFRADLDFFGPWHVGKLCGRGYGRIIERREKAQ